MNPYWRSSCGRYTIFHGDCLEILPTLEADVLVTDPPYGMAYASGWMDRRIENDHNTSARDAALALWSRAAIVFGRWDCPRPALVRQRLVWSKGDWPGMGDLSFPWGPSDEEIYIIGDGFSGKRSGTVLNYNRLTGNTLHPNEKPVSLIRELLDKCPPGVVVDPFMGSGTTLVACVRNERPGIGIEIEERYCEIAARRIEREATHLFAETEPAKPDHPPLFDLDPTPGPR